jgi:hypothetical protein
MLQAAEQQRRRSVPLRARWRWARVNGENRNVPACWEAVNPRLVSGGNWRGGLEWSPGWAWVRGEENWGNRTPGALGLEVAGAPEWGFEALRRRQARLPRTSSRHGNRGRSPRSRPGMWGRNNRRGHRTCSSRLPGALFPLPRSRIAGGSSAAAFPGRGGLGNQPYFRPKSPRNPQIFPETRFCPDRWTDLFHSAPTQPGCNELGRAKRISQVVMANVVMSKCQNSRHHAWSRADHALFLPSFRTSLVFSGIQQLSNFT